MEQAEIEWVGNTSPASGRSVLWGPRGQLSSHSSKGPDLSVVRRFAYELLDDNAIAPLALQLAVPVIGSNLSETGSLMQGETGGVLWKDARDQLPITSLNAG